MRAVNQLRLRVIAVTLVSINSRMISLSRIYAYTCSSALVDVCEALVHLTRTLTKIANHLEDCLKDHI